MPDLHDIFVRQEMLQVESFGIDPRNMLGVERQSYLTAMSWALVTELNEALDHTNWKPWAKLAEPGALHDRDKYVKELVDVLHFLVNLFLVAGADATEVYNRYLKKADVNARRQVEGYDARSTKDPETGEALDEPD